MNKRLTILSATEQAALYELPDFNDAQRLEYLHLMTEEQILMHSRSHLAAKVYCALQIGYFKAKHLFFRFTWVESKEDTAFILKQYFSDHDVINFTPKAISSHEHHVQSAMPLQSILVAKFGHSILKHCSMNKFFKFSVEM